MGTLYIVATPIGNLEDMTLRAIRVLRESDVVFCEDTRTSRVLFDKYEIKAPTESFHAKSPLGKIDRIVELLEGGKMVSLVSDAGTPGVSDPGSLLVSEVRKRLPEAAIVPIPGASALTAALSIAGIGAHEFVFLGFFPHKKGRATLFAEMAAADRAYVFYESPHRIMKTLESLAPLGKRVTVMKELTKMFEESVSGTGAEVLSYFTQHPDKVRGEFVVIVGAGS